MKYSASVSLNRPFLFFGGRDRACQTGKIERSVTCWPNRVRRCVLIARLGKENCSEHTQLSTWLAGCAVIHVDMKEDCRLAWSHNASSRTPQHVSRAHLELRLRRRWSNDLETPFHIIAVCVRDTPSWPRATKPNVREALNGCLNVLLPVRDNVFVACDFAGVQLFRWQMWKTRAVLLERWSPQMKATMIKETSEVSSRVTVCYKIHKRAYARTHIHIRTHGHTTCTGTFIHVQPGAVMVLWRHLRHVHVTQVHQMTSENQFHRTRRYRVQHNHLCPHLQTKQIELRCHHFWLCYYKVKIWSSLSSSKTMERTISANIARFLESRLSPSHCTHTVFRNFVTNTPLS